MTKLGASLNILLWALFFAVGAAAGSKIGYYKAEKRLGYLTQVSRQDSIYGKMARTELKYFSHPKYIASGIAVGGIAGLVIYGGIREYLSRKE